MPDREREMLRLCALNRFFYDTCKDYEDAAAAVKYWLEVEGNTNRTNEYRHLVADLETEILIHLKTAEPS
jgi:hypothetical protein